MKFSIIIPVYNAQEYLRECLDSVLQQTYSDFEILLVNDGSTDSSGQICDEYAAQDNRIIVIHQKNSGVSTARNKALEIAQGEYLMFLDSDDFLLTDEALKQIAVKLDENNIDVLIYNHSIVKNDESIPKNNPEEQVENTTLKELIKNNKVTHLVWDKVIKRELVANHNLTFLSVERLEDSEFFGKIIAYAKNYDYLPLPVYGYRKRTGSLTTKSITKKIVSDYFVVFDEIKKFERQITDEKVKRNFLSYSAYPYLAALGMAELYTDKHKEKNQLSDLTYILKYNDDPRVQTVAKIYKVFGKRITIKLLKLAAKRRFKVE